MDGLFRVPRNVRALFNLLPHFCIASVVAHPHTLHVCSVFRLARAAHRSRQLEICSGHFKVRVCVRCASFSVSLEVRVWSDLLLFVCLVFSGYPPPPASLFFG
jgi:hypothetical protein